MKLLTTIRIIKFKFILQRVVDLRDGEKNTANAQKRCFVIEKQRKQHTTAETLAYIDHIYILNILKTTPTSTIAANLLLVHLLWQPNFPQRTPNHPTQNRRLMKKSCRNECIIRI